MGRMGARAVSVEGPQACPREHASQGRLSVGHTTFCLFLPVFGSVPLIQGNTLRPPSTGTTVGHTQAMALSRTNRILILLVIDVLFFIVEITVGYIIGSLALVADSFHMLNDVLSLLIALYAIRLSSKPSSNARLSYGWNRAEILAALINGVFLLALCFSIGLEAISRFVDVPVISHPRLVVIVGCAGFLTSIIGIFLFHEHGHGHSHGHDHSQGNTLEDGHNSFPLEPSLQNVAGISNTLPPRIQVPLDADVEASSPIPPLRPASLASVSDNQQTDPVTQVPRAATDNAIPFPSSGEKHLQPVHRSGADPWIPPVRRLSYSSLYGYPPANRAMLIQAAHEIASRASSDSQESQTGVEGAGDAPSIYEMPIGPAHPPSAAPSAHSKSHASHGHHAHHAHHGHSHGAMNMRGILLHVMGDALGNLGVVASGLVIWFAKGKFRFYFDPLISLIITGIIFSSALPLVRSASYILLQGVPRSIDVADVESAILAIDGVQSLHELHVWQLSETKLVASVHVATFRTHDFMTVALNIRKSLHHLGIHSSTIQPEYDHPFEPYQDEPDKLKSSSTCLILCPSDQKCDPWQNSCCPPAAEV